MALADVPGLPVVRAVAALAQQGLQELDNLLLHVRLAQEIGQLFARERQPVLDDGGQVVGDARFGGAHLVGRAEQVEVLQHLVEAALDLGEEGGERGQVLAVAEEGELGGRELVDGGGEGVLAVQALEVLFGEGHLEVAGRFLGGGEAGFGEVWQRGHGVSFELEFAFFGLFL